MADIDLADMRDGARRFMERSREGQSQAMAATEEHIVLAQRKLACMLIGAAATSLREAFPAIAVVEFEVSEGYEDSDDVTLLAATDGGGAEVELRPDFQADHEAIFEAQRLLGRASDLGIRFADGPRRRISRRTSQLTIADPLDGAMFHPAEPVG